VWENNSANAPGKRCTVWSCKKNIAGVCLFHPE
jgi:hypothetical protein